MLSVVFRHRPVQAVVPALLLIAPISGCGPSQSQVTGTVRYKGKPLPSGTIQFLASDGLTYPGTIQADGSFAVRVPAGEAKVLIRCVDEERLSRFTARLAGKSGRIAAPAVAAGNFSLIPQRYADWSTSRLAVRVMRGKTTQDFDLTPN
jgi:hypothetical protein